MYRTIHTKVWNDDKVRKLAPLDKLVFVYLLTNRHSHLCGLYYLPRVLAEHEVGTKVRWDKLKSLVEYDEEREQVWVTNMYGYQARGPKIKTAVERHVLTLESSPIVFLFAQKYGFAQVLKKLNDKYRVSIPNRYTIDSPPVPVPVPDTVPVPVPVPVPVSGISVRNLSNGHAELSPAEIVAQWNARSQLKPVKLLTVKLSERIAIRVREHPDPGWWKALFDTVTTSKFLTGRTNKPFFATLDWCLGPENLAKIQQGNYDDMPMPDGFDSLRAWLERKNREQGHDPRRLC